MKRSQFRVPYENFDRLYDNGNTAEYWIEVARGEEDEEYPNDLMNQYDLRDDISYALFREDSPGVEVVKTAGVTIIGHTLERLEVNTGPNNILFEGTASGITHTDPDEREEYTIDFHIEDRGQSGLEFYVRYQENS